MSFQFKDLDSGSWNFAVFIQQQILQVPDVGLITQGKISKCLCPDLLCDQSGKENDEDMWFFSQPIQL